jgi:hypothetical protein
MKLFWYACLMAMWCREQGSEILPHFKSFRTDSQVALTRAALETPRKPSPVATGAYTDGRYRRWHQLCRPRPAIEASMRGWRAHQTPSHGGSTAWWRR